MHKLKNQAGAELPWTTSMKQVIMAHNLSEPTISQTASSNRSLLHDSALPPAAGGKAHLWHEDTARVISEQIFSRFYEFVNYLDQTIGTTLLPKNNIKAGELKQTLPEIKKS